MSNPNVLPRFLKADTESITVYPRFLVDSLVEVEVDISQPIHITEVVPGMVLRIAMKAGRHLDPERGRKQAFYRSSAVRRQRATLFPEPPPDARGMNRIQTAPKRKRTGNRAQAFSRTVFLAYVSVNDTVNGQLTVNLKARGRHTPTQQAVINYSDIFRVQRYIHQLTPRAEAGSRPGSVAFGSTNDFGFMKLVPVRF